MKLSDYMSFNIYEIAEGYGTGKLIASLDTLPIDIQQCSGVYPNNWPPEYFDAFFRWKNKICFIVSPMFVRGKNCPIPRYFRGLNPLCPGDRHITTGTEFSFPWTKCENARRRDMWDAAIQERDDGDIREWGL